MQIIVRKTIIMKKLSLGKIMLLQHVFVTLCFSKMHEWAKFSSSSTIDGGIRK